MGLDYISKRVVPLCSSKMDLHNMTLAVLLSFYINVQWFLLGSTVTCLNPVAFDTFRIPLVGVVTCNMPQGDCTRNFLRTAVMTVTINITHW